MKKLCLSAMILSLLAAGLTPALAGHYSVPDEGSLSAVAAAINGSSDLVNTVEITEDILAGGALTFSRSTDIAGTVREVTLGNTGTGRITFGGTTQRYSLQNLTVDGTGGFTINSGNTLGVSAIDFTNNSTSSTGGVFNVAGGTVNITSENGTVNFLQNRASGNGGAIYAASGGTVNIDAVNGNDINFTGNTSSSYGGWVYATGNSTINVTADNANINIEGNSGTYGGGIYNSGSTFNVITKNGGTVNFIGNRATSSHGGAIDLIASGTATLSAQGGNITLADNTAPGTGSDGGGAVYIHGGSILTLTSSSQGNILFDNNRENVNAAEVNNDIRMEGTGKVIIDGNAGIVALNSGVIGATTSVVEKSNNGTLVLGRDANNSSYLGTYTQTGGTTTVYGEFFNNAAQNNISNSNLNFYQDGDYGKINRLSLTNVNVGSKNGALNTTRIGTLYVNDVNNFDIDVNAQTGESDKFQIDALSGNGTLNVHGIGFIGALTAPVVDLQVFEVGTDPGTITYSSTSDSVATPLYMYGLSSLGDGTFRLQRGAFNKQALRGQVATMASYYNQLVVNNILLDHVYLDSNENIAFGGGRQNQYASLEGFGPYQFSRKNEGVWTKNYGNFERLFMTHGAAVDNNAYGTIIGADFQPRQLGNGWQFLPTIFAGYNGGHQTFDRVGMWQNGGQGGFMGTFAREDFIASILAYVGGYGNSMDVARGKDHTGNWFTGSSLKGAYNFHPTRNFIIQPSLLLSYNLFGKQNWHSDFGAVSMNSGFLNGLNMAPGLNLIYGQGSWSAYLTTLYMYNINEQISGQIDGIHIPSLKMRHGYIEYGLGATKSFGEQVGSYVQVTARNGGRNGIGLQGGLLMHLDTNSSPKELL